MDVNFNSPDSQRFVGDTIAVGCLPKHCPVCDAAFACGGACWCADLPPIFPPDESATCLCPECLTRRAADVIRETLEKLTPEKAARIRALGPVVRPVKGIDFYLNPDGFMVFTEWYHLRRGGCCGNGCRHCPYPNPADPQT